MACVTALPPGIMERPEANNSSPSLGGWETRILISVLYAGEIGHIHQYIRKLGINDFNLSETEDSMHRYFHVVFTVPEELNPIIYSNQKFLYAALYHAASDTLSELARWL